VAVLEHVLERVDAPVAGGVGNEQAVLVEHGHEAGGAPPRRDVAPALAVRRRDEQEGRAGDEVSAVAVDVIGRLAADGRRRGAVQADELIRRPGDATEAEVLVGWAHAVTGAPDRK
jgi:hypothetical protein